MAGECFRCLSTKHKVFRCREPIKCYRCKGNGHFERHCQVSAEELARRSATPSPPSPPAAASSGHPPPPAAAAPAWPPLQAATPTPAAVMAHSTRRSDTSCCIITSTPSMERESHRLRTTALFARAIGGRPRVSAA
jgi:hypothetical protein